METLELLHTQITSLSDKVQKLTNTVNKLQTSCNQRHKVDLYSEIQKVDWCTRDLDKNIHKQEEINKQINGVHNKLDDDIDQVKAMIDGMKIRITSLQKQLNQTEQRKFTIKSQIIITVIGTLILTFITSISGMIWNTIINNHNSNYYNNSCRTNAEITYMDKSINYSPDRRFQTKKNNKQRQ